MTTKQTGMILHWIKMVDKGGEGEVEDREQVQRLFPDNFVGVVNPRWVEAQDKLSVLTVDEASMIIKLFIDGNISEALNQIEHLI